VQASLIIGLAAGLLVVAAAKLCDAMKIDDPVGAVPVHLFNGVFGTLCVGLFAVDKITGAATGNGLFYGGGMTLLMAQLKGIGAVAVYTLAVSLIFWFAVKMVMACASARRKRWKVSTSASTANGRISSRKRARAQFTSSSHPDFSKACGLRCPQP
jgi:Amt family ammonium transporter